MFCFLVQFDSAEKGTPMKNTAFCGMWSLKNAEVLFKSTYTNVSGDSYGSISLDKYPAVSHATASLKVQTVRIHTVNEQWMQLVSSSSPLQLCFAYKGMLKNEVGMKFTYQDSQGQTQKETAKISTLFTKGLKSVNGTFHFSTTCANFSAKPQLLNAVVSRQMELQMHGPRELPADGLRRKRLRSAGVLPLQRQGRFLRGRRSHREASDCKRYGARS